MGRHFLFNLVAMTLLLGAGACTIYPLTAAAQEDPQSFNRRMSARIDAVQMRIKNLEKQLTSETAAEGRPSQYDPDSGLLRQLEDLDEQCRELEREIGSLGMRSIGPPGAIYEQQREVEYYVWGLESRVQQIRRWMRSAEDEPDSSVEPRPEPDTEEDGISDDDWAAEWAEGDP